MLIDTIRAKGGGDRMDARRIGQVAAELAVLRQMSVYIAGMLASGVTPNQEASVVKELGVALEQRIPDLARELAGSEPVCRALAEMHSAAMQLAPTFSLRGGTREIIRGIIARGLGLR
jgi:hypothetical protein